MEEKPRPYNTKRQAAISAIAQVIQEHAEEIDAFLRQESRDWLNQLRKWIIKQALQVAPIQLALNSGS